MSERPFRYGEADCALFAASVVKSLTGEDFAADFDYADKRGAVRALRREGGLEALVTKRLGAPIEATDAEYGDVALHAEYGALGVVLAEKAAFLGREGIVAAPLEACALAWRVPCRR